MQDYTTRELTPDESAALTKDLQEVLMRHNCEMGVISSINLMKRVETVSIKPEDLNEGVPSPYVENGESNEPETNTAPEESSESDSAEPAK